MKLITIKNKQYPLRTLEVRFKNIINKEETKKITIAPKSLEEALDLENNSGDILIDSEIYFYVNNQHFEKSGEKICKNHLDKEIFFINELIL